MAAKADRLLGVPERRTFKCEQFELRQTGKNTLEFNGYASVFDKGYEMYGGPENGGWTEFVNRHAVDETLKRGADVVLLLNHDGMPLARTKSKTLRLNPDGVGLHSNAELDRRDPDVQRLEVKAERGDLDEMSFAFRTIRHDWNDDETERELLELNLDKGDVSVVNFGANPHTSFGVRSAVAAIAAGDIAEMRALDQADLRSAYEILGQLIEAPQAPSTTASGMSVAKARRLLLLDA